MENLARWFQDITATDLLATDIPSINASLGELLGETPTPLALDNNELRNVSAVSEAGNFKKFTVEVKAGTNLLEGGVAIGDTVVYRSDGSNVQGEIEAVTPGGFVVRFAKARSQTPDADPSFRIQRRGSLQHQLEAFVDGLRTVFEGGLPVPTLAQGIPAVPTLQGLIETLAEVLGIKPKDAIEKLGVTSTGSGVDRVIQFAPEFNPAAITFDKKLDFGTAIPGLSFDAKSGSIAFAINPRFRLPFGIRLDPSLTVDERFFIVEDATPDLSLVVSAQLDDPTIAGTLGPIEIRLQEDDAVKPNKGLTVDGTVTINLVDPGTGVADDDRILRAELRPTSLTDVFEAGIDATFNIDGLLLRIDAGGDSLGGIKISLDGDDGGHITDFGALAGLLSQLQIDGDLDLANNFPITNVVKQAILDGIQALVDFADNLDDSAPFTQTLPIINTSVGQALDLPARLRQALLSPSSSILTMIRRPPYRNLPTLCGQKFPAWPAIPQRWHPTRSDLPSTCVATHGKDLALDLGTAASSLVSPSRQQMWIWPPAYGFPWPLASILMPH